MPKASRNVRWGRFGARLAPPLAVLALWQALASSGLVSKRLFPDLLEISIATIGFVESGDFLYHSGYTLGRTLAAFAIGVPAGVLIGMLLARSRRFEIFVEPIFVFGYPIPKIALYPVFVLVFGLGSQSKVALAALETLYPITLATYFGIRSTEKTLIWAGECMGGSHGRIFFRVLLPSAAPFIFSSLRIGIHIAMIVIIVLEIIGDSTGLGFYITYATASYKYPHFFAGIIAIMFWGFLLDQAMVWLRSRIVFWEAGLKFA